MPPDSYHQTQCNDAVLRLYLFCSCDVSGASDGRHGPVGAQPLSHSHGFSSTFPLHLKSLGNQRAVVKSLDLEPVKPPLIVCEEINTDLAEVLP